MNFEVSVATIAERLKGDAGDPRGAMLGCVTLCGACAAPAEGEVTDAPPAEDESALRSRLADIWRAYVMFEVLSFVPCVRALADVCVCGGGGGGGGAPGDYW